MKFYLCDTAPPTYARTQAEAKATGASFGPVEIDTSQGALTAMFNKLISEAAANSPPPHDGAAAEEPGQDDREAGTSISPPPRTKPAPVTVFGHHRCECCGRTEKGAKIMAALFDRHDLTDVAMLLAEPAHLDTLQAIIDERRADIAKAAPVNPPVRRRRPA